ncbi:hypothetical protein SBOR_0498 [Sclerotinia borealis F-4128]|uniref:Uncharacterized protein n=1 Tax=Sclerotinia borealis (strain F-4128) TaxID=1432307 RepID=W9CSI3_SCLBF|nr:hypothetical protein SBOR_0498 [Sclerotinia borealis F-4128]
MQALSNRSGPNGGIAHTRSEDPDSTALPESPVTADSSLLLTEVIHKAPQYFVAGYLTTASASTKIDVEESIEISSRNPEGTHQKISRYSSRENRGEVREPPEGDSLNSSLESQSVQQEEQSEIPEKPVPAQRNPFKDPEGNPPENFYRPSRESRPSNEIDDHRRSITNLRPLEVNRKNIPPNKRPHKQYPPPGIAAAVQPERQVGTKEDKETATPCHKNHVVKARCFLTGRTLPQRRHNSDMLIDRPASPNFASVPGG